LQVYEITQGDSLHFNKNDLSALRQLNKEFKRNWNKSAIKLSSGQIVKFNEEIIGILNLNEKIVIISPSIKGFDFDFILRMWTFLNFQTVKNKALEIPYFNFTFQNNRTNIIDLFINELYNLIQKGLWGNYVFYEDELKYKKGKIDLRKNFHKFLYEGTLFCKFEDFTINNFLNQVVYFCLRKVRFVSFEHKLNSKIVYLLNFFRGINQLFNVSPQQVDSIILNRQNLYYKKILGLCKIIIKNLSISSIGGSSPNYSFLFDFNYLFELFIKKILIIFGRKNDFIYWNDFKSFGSYVNDKGELLYKKYLPDILYRYDSNNKSAEIVIDVKNKFNGVFMNKDIYQVFFYSNILKTRRKIILIYPTINSRSIQVLPVYFKNYEYIFYSIFFPVGCELKNFHKKIQKFVNDLYSIIENKL